MLTPKDEASLQYFVTVLDEIARALNDFEMKEESATLRQVTGELRKKHSALRAGNVNAG